MAKTAVGQWQLNDVLHGKNVDYLFNNQQSLFMYSNNAGSLFRSDDNGLNWAKKLTIPPIHVGYQIELIDYFIFGDTILICTENRVFRSIDNANTWTFSTISNAESYFFIDNTLYCQTNDNIGNLRPIFFSPDYGNTWLPNTSSILNQTTIISTAILHDTTYALIGSFPIQLCRMINIDNFDTIHTFSQSNFPYQLISNNGKMFVLSIENSIITASLCDNSGMPILNDFELNSETTSLFHINDTVFITANNKFEYTIDYGQTWDDLEVLTNGYFSKGLFRINNINYAIYDNIILRDNGQNNWEFVNDVLYPPARIQDFKKIDNNLFYKLDNVFCKKSHYQNDAKVISPLINDTIKLFEIKPFKNVIFGLNNYYGFYKSFDDGDTWSYLDIDLSFYNTSWSIYHYQFLQNNDSIFFFVNNSFDTSNLYLSINNGTSWTKIFNNESGGYSIPFPIDANFFFKNNEYIFIGNNNTGNYIRLLYQNGVIESTQSHYQPETQIFNVGNNIFKSTTNFVWNQYVVSFEKSTDNGDTWQTACNGLPNNHYAPNSYQFMGNDSVMFCYIKQNNNIYSSFDKGISWFSIIDNLIGETITSANFSNDSIYVNVAHKGLYSRSIEDMNPICVSGKIFVDMNGNSQFEINYDQPVENINVYSLNSFSNNNSNQNGDYYIFLLQSPTIDTIKVLNTILYSTVTPEYHVVNQADTSKNFAITRIQGINDLRVDLTNPIVPRPGFDYVLYITWKNEGTTTLNATVSLTLDDLFNYQNASEPPATILGNVINWEIQNFQPLESKTITVNLYLPFTTLIGEQVDFFTTISPILGDTTMENNTDSISDITVNGYDPNDKQVNRPMYLSPLQVLNKTEMVYTVRFQNTGTWYAENVSILDTLHHHLDLSTFRVIAASHDYNFDFSGNGIVRFNFPNINLPDSNMNEAASHGFIKYAIRLNNNIPLNDSITNTAHIYFDFNEAIVTNTTLNIVKVDASINETTEDFNAVVYPNPARTQLNIRFEKADSYQISMYSIDGRLVFNEKTNNAQHSIHVASLNKGIYLLKISDENRSKIVKIVIQ